MSSDDVVSRELKSLQEELAAAQRERSTAPATPPPPVSASEPAPHSEEQHEWRDQLGELASALTTFLEEAERDIAAHPARSVVGALVVGIVIGRLLGRRGGRMT